MDYKEKYNKLVKAVKVLQKTNPSDEGIQNWVNDNVPDLTESEDEKTRKEFCKDIWAFIPNEKANKYIAWLEKQCKCETDCHSNHQDANHPNGCITLEDFNDGEGFYKVHLDYLNKKQVEEIEEMIRTWNKELKVPNENIKSCIGMCLTDVCEQRFRDYNTSLKDCLAWLEKQGAESNWSKEDEMKLNQAIYVCHQNGYDDVENWLKSLKQRYAWEPNDAQMQALKEACDKHWEPDGLDPLYTLYEDLERLKE